MDSPTLAEHPAPEHSLRNQTALGVGGATNAASPMHVSKVFWIISTEYVLSTYMLDFLVWSACHRICMHIFKRHF